MKLGWPNRDHAYSDEFLEKENYVPPDRLWQLGKGPLSIKRVLIFLKAMVI